MTHSPIVLFVYNRLNHTQQTIKSLQQNKLSKQSNLFIYSDAAATETEQENVAAVRAYIKIVTGFKSVTIVEKLDNQGLAESIISGVTEIVNEFGKVIVMEDDLVTAPYFLTFMNDALDFYEDNKKVWHISGWNYPFPDEFNDDTFLWRTMNCWGWATWADRWFYFEKNTDKLISSFSKEDINSFNLDGVHNFWSQVLANKTGKLNTWAIYWYATIFKHNGLCLNPVKSFVDNIGNDGSGTNCGSIDAYKIKLSDSNPFKFSPIIEENKLALSIIQNFYHTLVMPLPVRIINKLSKNIFKRNILK